MMSYAVSLHITRHRELVVAISLLTSCIFLILPTFSCFRGMQNCPRLIGVVTWSRTFTVSFLLQFTAMAREHNLLPQEGQLLDILWAPGSQWIPVIYVSQHPIQPRRCHTINMLLKIIIKVGAGHSWAILLPMILLTGFSIKLVVEQAREFNSFSLLLSTLVGTIKGNPKRSQQSLSVSGCCSSKVICFSHDTRGFKSQCSVEPEWKLLVFQIPTWKAAHPFFFDVSCGQSRHTKIQRSVNLRGTCTLVCTHSTQKSVHANTCQHMSTCLRINPSKHAHTNPSIHPHSQ